MYNNFITQVLINETKKNNWGMRTYSLYSTAYNLSVNCHKTGRWAAIANFLPNNQHYGLCCCHRVSNIKNSISNSKKLFIDFERL